jgi:allantoicase
MQQVPLGPKNTADENAYSHENNIDGPAVILKKQLDEHHQPVEHHALPPPSQQTEAKHVTPTHSSPFINKQYTNLISSRTSTVLFATDEWFARAENLLSDTDPEFISDLYCEQGKVMDGWETRRRRVEGHDWCIVALGNDGGNDLYGVELDTAFFTGNQTPRVSIQVANCRAGSDCDDDCDEGEEWKYTWMPGAVSRMARGGGVQGTGMKPQQVKRAEAAAGNFNWTEVLPMTELRPGYEETRIHYFHVNDEIREEVKGFTHVRVNYYPDGGVARLRLWGHEVKEESDIACTRMSNKVVIDELDALPSAKPYPEPELSCEINGGQGLACSNKHYGVPSNLIRQGYGKDMGDGWETARHPDRPPILIKDPETGLIDSPLMDWAILKLGMGGCNENGVSRIILDTKHFKGNFPESVKIEACDASSLPLNLDNETGEEKKTCDDGTCGEEILELKWFPLLNRSRMGPDREHVFDRNSKALVNSKRKMTHIRVSIFPDGGLSRVRIYGQPMESSLPF